MSRTNDQRSLLHSAVMSKNAVVFDAVVACVEHDLSPPEVSIVTRPAKSISNIFREHFRITGITCLRRTDFVGVLPHRRTTAD